MNRRVYLLQYYERECGCEWTQGVYATRELAEEYAITNKHLMKGWGYVVREYEVREISNDY